MLPLSLLWVIFLSQCLQFSFLFQEDEEGEDEEGEEDDGEEGEEEDGEEEGEGDE